jgi:hypothetical protein
VKPIKDNTYQTYCSRLRQYRRAVEDAKLAGDTEKLEMWQKEVIRMEARLISIGREVPPKDEEVKDPTTVNKEAELRKLSYQKEFEMYLTSYRWAKNNGNKQMMENFKGVIEKLGYKLPPGEEEPAA